MKPLQIPDSKSAAICLKLQHTIVVVVSTFKPCLFSGNAKVAKKDFHCRQADSIANLQLPMLSSSKIA